MKPFNHPQPLQPSGVNIYDWLLILVICILLFAAFSKPAGGREIQTGSHSFVKPDTTSPGQPKVNIKVKRKFDEHGNVTGFDSAYSYEFNFNGGSIPREIDSMMRSFGMHFGMEPGSAFHFPSMPDEFFSDPFSQFHNGFPMDSIDNFEFGFPWPFSLDTGMYNIPEHSFIPADSGWQQFHSEPFTMPPGFYSMPGFSPDGNRMLPRSGNDSIFSKQWYDLWKENMDSIRKARPKNKPNVWY
jgi:hypothetical protein